MKERRKAEEAEGRRKRKRRRPFGLCPLGESIGFIVTRALSGKSFSRRACRVSSRGLTSVLGGAVSIRGRSEGFSSRVSRWGLASALGGKALQKDPQVRGIGLIV